MRRAMVALAHFNIFSVAGRQVYRQNQVRAGLLQAASIQLRLHKGI